jgi:hypothetical protein
MLKWMKPTLKFILVSMIMSLLIFWIVCFYGCASKTLKITSMDDRGNPISIEGSVLYFCTDTNTKGFTAQFGEKIKIGLASQDAQTRTELMLEFMKLVSSMP